MTKKQTDDVEQPPVTIGQTRQDFDLSQRRAMLALEAVKLGVISNEEAGAVVRAFLASPVAT